MNCERAQKEAGRNGGSVERRRGDEAKERILQLLLKLAAERELRRGELVDVDVAFSGIVQVHAVAAHVSGFDQQGAGQDVGKGPDTGIVADRG